MTTVEKSMSLVVSDELDFERALVAKLAFPTDHPREGVTSYAHDRVRITLSDELHSQLERLAEQQGAPLFPILISAWAVVLGRWSTQDSVVVAVDLSRGSTGLSTTEELKAELTVQVDLQPNPTGAQLIAQVLSATAQRESGSVAHGSVEEDTLPSVAVRWDRPRRGDSRFELVLSLDRRDGFIVLAIDYARTLFHATTARRLLESYEVLLDSVSRDPNAHASRLSLLTAAERQRAIYAFNPEPAPELPTQLIHELFERQVVRTPHAIAVLHNNDRLTYEELNRRANRLARHLRRCGAGRNQLIGLCVERSADMVVGILAVLKAGAAYVPMDPAYPAERLAYMLEIAASPVLLTQRYLREVLSGTDSLMVEIDGDWGVDADYDDSNLSRKEIGLTASDLAYVIFTSGSTGAPKGAMNEHRGMVNRIEAAETIERYDLEDICSQKTSLSFVDAVFEIFGALSVGCPLVIVPGRIANDPPELASFIAGRRITRLLTVPSLARSMLESADISRELSHLRSWTLSGEEVRPDLLNKLQQQLPKCQFIIQYGSSEVSSDAAIYTTTQLHSQRVPLGKPLPNTSIRILDRHGEPVPVGVVGEIHVCGVNVGRGYLNRADLTSSRFVRDPFASAPDARMFKTGDMGRWRSDGLVEYFGRADHQVKIRGFRIELGEIETQLLKQARVREAVVVARALASGDQRLVAYVTLREQSSDAAGSRTSVEFGCGDLVSALRSHLKMSLPEYMVPAAIVVLPQMPLTPNGKLDRRALPAPKLDAYATAEYQPPIGAPERALAGVWQRVLGVPRVGRYDNFFQLGGHSLLIMRMLQELRRQGFRGEPRDVYAAQTLADLAAAMKSGSDEVYVPPNAIPLGADTITPEMLPLVSLDDAQLQQVVQCVPGGAANIQDIYPLAPLQEGIFFHHLLSSASGDTYVRPLLLSLSSRQQLDELSGALRALMSRHDVLRTAVLWENLPRPVQVVYREAPLPIEEWMLAQDRPVSEQLDERMRLEHQKLDLRRAPLLKLQVAADPDGTRFYALLQTHHLIFDDESLDLMLEELVAHMEGNTDQLHPALPYRNHVARTLAQTESRDGQAFFRHKLADVDEPTAPFGLLDVHADGHRVEVAEGGLDAELSRRLRTQARRWGTSAATLFHAAWAVVVSRTSGRDDIVYGSVLLGRMQGCAGAERTLGMFINTLPLRLRLTDTSAEGLMEQTGRELAELLDHEQTSLAVAQRCSGIGGSLPLFTSLLNYLHGAPDSHEHRRALAPGIQVLASHDWTNYPIVLSVNDLGDEFTLHVQTDRRVDPMRVLEYTRTALRSLTAALECAPHTPVSRLRILPEAERHQVVEAFNATEVRHLRPALIHALFEAQVHRTPDAPALLCGEERLTYTQLNGRANCLAHRLIESGVRPDDRVALYLERSALLMIGVLASLKAGAAYVPIDISHPPARVAYILEDSAPAVVLTQRCLVDRLPSTRADVVVLDTDDGVQRHFELNPDSVALGLQPSNLAYVIYTSGSTGVPKGVMVEHHATANLIHWSNSAFGITARSHCSCVAAFGFDATVWEMWPPLCVGAVLLLADSKATRDPDSLLRWWAESRIDVGFLPTPMAELALARGIHKPELRHLLVGGDRLRSRGKAQSYSLVNNYGPTECTVVTTSGVIRDDDDSLHIGRSIDNLRVYILDAHLEPVPIGVTGEIYIGGAGVARGYLNRPELTAERFICDPVRPRSGERVFKSGDLGRWRADGNIEYMGRNDQQVKIRGLRIELGEIEAQLTSHAQVKDAVVLPRELAPGEARLVAYVVPSNQSDVRSVLAADALRAHLTERLPQYMVPSAVVMLEQFPLTTNGKLDRQALPAPDLDAYEHGQYEAPEGALEQLIASIWKDLLRVERVGRDDNFFELGGHSLLATQMLGRLRAAVASDVSMRDLFDFASVRRLAAHLRQAGFVEDESGDDDMEELLAAVAMLPQAEVDELLQQLSAEDR